MKKIFALIIAIMFILTACATPSTDTSSVDATSSEVISEDTSETADSSEETSSEEEVALIREIDGIKYYDPKAAGADKQLIYVDPFTGVKTGDHSAYFPEDAEGYYFDDMTFYVNAETFDRILSKPCIGKGSIKWTEYNEELSWHGDETGPNGERIGNDGFHGILPVEKFNDPLYVFLCKPSERPTVMNRVNASNLSHSDERFDSILTIGAIYNNSEKAIPDDAEFTICIGRTTLIFYTEEDGWFMAGEWDTPSKPNSIYYLPWTLESTLGSIKLTNDRVELVDDHYEIKMTGAMLNGNYGKGKEAGATGSVLHFWGPKVKLEDLSDLVSEPTEIKAVASSFECWIKEAEYAEYVVAAIGVDWYDDEADTSKGEQRIFQGYSGHNYALTTEPRVIFGHTAGPDMYDDVMDTEKVQEMLGLK